MRWNMQSTIPIVASTKKMPKESKKAKRSTALSKQLHLEVIRINWQHEINLSSIADLKPVEARLRNALKVKEWR